MLTEAQKKTAVEAYAKFGVLSEAAKIADTTRWIVYAEMKKNSAFKKKMEEAKVVYVDYLESILNKRIEEGTDKASAILLMFKLKREIPEYRDKFEHKVDASVRIITGVPRPQ